MSSYLHRRLARIEQSMSPQPDTVVVNEPGSGSDDWAAFRIRLQEAKSTGARVLVAREGLPVGDRELSNEYGALVLSPFEASGEYLASQPSKTGRANAFADVLAARSGKIIGVAAVEEQLQKGVMR